MVGSIYRQKKFDIIKQYCPVKNLRIVFRIVLKPVLKITRRFRFQIALKKGAFRINNLGL